MQNLINLLNNLQITLNLSTKDEIYLIIIFILITIIIFQFVLLEKIRRSPKPQKLEIQLEEERKKRQKIQEKFRAIFHQTFEFIGLLDLEGNLLEANATALNIVGVKAETVIGKPFWETPWWSHSSQVQTQFVPLVFVHP